MLAQDGASFNSAEGDGRASRETDKLSTDPKVGFDEGFGRITREAEIIAGKDAAFWSVSSNSFGKLRSGLDEGVLERAVRDCGELTRSVRRNNEITSFACWFLRSMILLNSCEKNRSFLFLILRKKKKVRKMSKGIHSLYKVTCSEEVERGSKG